MVKVSVLGRFGEGLKLLNGQTVKTRIVTEELQNQLGQEQVMKIDTHGGWKTLLKAPFQAIWALKKSANVIIFPAENGLSVYAPLLTILRGFFKNKKIHYVVIGGWLPKFLRTRRLLSNALKSFDGIYVETNTMKAALEKQGFSNVFVMPNCKELTIISEEELAYPQGAPYKLCTFSRVMREKGIEEAVKAVTQLNTKSQYRMFELDIFGQIESTQVKWFENLRGTFPDYIQYKGTIPFNESTEILKEYDALLFPTFYKGEGFAGTIIDAFAAGLPVIASDWKYNSELIDSRKTGLLYETHNIEALKSAITSICDNTGDWNEMKRNCLRKAAMYQPSNAMKMLIERIQ